MERHILDLGDETDNIKPSEYVIDENGCHNVVSHAKDNFGYTKIRRLGRTFSTHRYVYLKKKWNGDSIPSDVVIRHQCHNPACINIDHLLEGSHADNVADRVAAGRSANLEKNGRSALTIEQVIKIYLDTEHTQTYLAKKYGVTRKTIYHIWNNILWTEVTSKYRHLQPDYGGHVRGSDVHCSRLTKAQVIEKFLNRDMPVMYYARKFNVDRKTVWNVRNGNSWKHVTDNLVVKPGASCTENYSMNTLNAIAS